MRFIISHVQLFIYIAGKVLKTVSLDGISFCDMYDPYPMTITDDGVLITTGSCKPHQSTNNPIDSQTTRSDNRSSTENSKSTCINNDSVDHSDGGTEDMSGQSDSEEEEEVECLVYYKLNY